MYREMWLLIIVSTLAGLWIVHSVRKPKNFPPGPAWLPLLGCSLKVRDEAIKFGLLKYEVFEKMSKKFATDVLGLKLGQQLVVVVFGHRVLKELYRNPAFFARPNNIFGKLRTLGSCPGITSAEGLFHTVQKKFIMKSWFEDSNSVALEMKIREELEDVMKLIDAGDGKVSVGVMGQSAVINVMWSMVSGNRIDRNDGQFQKLRDLIDKRRNVFDMEGGMLSNFPWLRYVTPNLVGYNLIKEINLNFRNFISKTIAHHYKTWSPGRKDDLIYSFISRMRSEDEHSGTFQDDQLLMIVVDLIIAGTHTTSSTFDFACLLMLLYPEVQRKVRKDLKETFRPNHVVKYSDRFKVPYVLAVIYEIIRFCYVIPIGGSRRALTNTKLDGYAIPKDTIILIDMHSVLKSEEIWKDPNVFRPERFLDGHRIKIYRDYIPFGMGRRRCLGEKFALRFLFVFFAELLRKYQIVSEVGKPLPSTIPVPGMVFSPQPYTASFILRENKSC